MTDCGGRRESVESSLVPASTASASAVPRLRVRVLGPVTVDVDGLERRLTARRQRAVLACLALHPGVAMSADRLLEEVWGEDLPDTGAHTVAYQISKLRNALEPDRVGEGTLITTTSAGYSVRIAADDVDVHRFERLVDEARAQLIDDPAGGHGLAEEALELWRGRPFADLDDEPFVHDETHRLEQRHLLARRTRAEAAVALGRHTDVVGELEELVEDHPLEEALVLLLMTALDRSGRIADALRVYGQLRLRLGDELGIEPSNNLQQLEQRLLVGDTVPTATAARARPRPVPAALTSFVGRAGELAGIEELLSSARLVTLVGFGGLGKTRLAQEIAARIGDRLADGVWYVDLTSIADADVLAHTIVAAGGLTVSPDRDPIEHLLSLLDEREALVVIDNCEHLVDGVATLVAKLVAAAPHVRVLATSRVSLGVIGEAVWTVHPLEPVSDVELFVDRARVVCPGFVVDETNRAEIERLCEQLDRIPLTLEMAAARLAVMSVAQIADHLDDRFGLLTASGRVSDERQRSLAAVMDWSYELLDEPDRRLLRRLSACTGGFDLEAATRIGTPDPSDASVSGVLDRLSHLVEASLVTFGARDGRPRYRMLETVRQYGAVKLGPDERDEVALAHATHYESVASTIFDLASTDQFASLQLAERELGNLRAAMSWAYGNGHPRLGLSIANSTFHYFNGNFMYREELRWLRTGLELIDHDDADTFLAAALALIEASNIADVDAMRAALTQVERGLDTVDEPRLRAELLSARGVFVDDTDPRAGDAYFVQALDLGASLPHRAEAKLNNRIDVAWEIGQLEDGEAILHRVGEISEPIKSPQNQQMICLQCDVAALAGRMGRSDPPRRA